jgi:integrase
MLISAVDKYLALRRACGFKMRTAGYYLHSFARFASERGDSHVQSQTAIEWAASAPSASTKEEQIRAVHRFARHVRAEDTAHELPPTHIFASGRPKRPVPYIYSHDEIERILHAACELGPVGSIRPLTYYALFGLLAATGLRISEALALRIDDITEDGLFIRETKFHKSRLVPLHETTSVAMQRYLEQRCKTGGFDNQLFISHSQRGLSYNTAAHNFRSLVTSIGLQPRTGQRAPTLHCMRHSFAVRSLEACPRGRDNVTRHLLALSTYLGHAHASDTYWYLQATPHLMADIADACEAFIEGKQL